MGRAAENTKGRSRVHPRRNAIGTTLTEEGLAAVWGIDPGTRTMGIAVIQRSQSFTATLYPNPKLINWWKRSLGLAVQFTIMVDVASDRGQTAFGIEMPAIYASQGNVAVKLGDARGMVISEITHLSSVVPELDQFVLFPDIHPGTIRYSLAGSKSATNKEMIAAAKYSYWTDFQGTKHEAMEEASALGIALATLRRYQNLDKPSAPRLSETARPGGTDGAG